jgi:hypothetical protein
VQDVTRRRDRVAAEEERSPGAARRGDEAERGGGVAGDVAVVPGRDGGGLDAVRGVEHLGRLAEVPSRFQHAHVGFADGRGLLETLLDPADGRLDRALEEPRGEAEREEVARTHHGARRQPHVVEGVDRQLGDVDREDLKAVERAVGQRVGRVLRLLEVLLVELLLVDDENAVGLEVIDVDLERGRIHRHQDVGRIARREHVAAGEVQLEAADARQRAGRGANLGWKVGQGAQVVADQRRLVGEVHARELHAVTRVTGEANDDLIAFLDLFQRPRTCGGGALWVHVTLPFCPSQPHTTVRRHAPRDLYGRYIGGIGPIQPSVWRDGGAVCRRRRAFRSAAVRVASEAPFSGGAAVERLAFSVQRMLHHRPGPMSTVGTAGWPGRGPRDICCKALYRTLNAQR